MNFVYDIVSFKKISYIETDFLKNFRGGPVFVEALPLGEYSPGGVDFK